MLRCNRFKQFLDPNTLTLYRDLLTLTLLSLSDMLLKCDSNRYYSFIPQFVNMLPNCNFKIKTLIQIQEIQQYNQFDSLFVIASQEFDATQVEATTLMSLLTRWQTGDSCLKLAAALLSATKCSTRHQHCRVAVGKGIESLTKALPFRRGQKL